MATATKEKAAKVAKECACGCGLPTTKEFAVGHDAKVKGFLYSVIRGEDSKIVAPPNFEDFTKAQAIKYIDGRGWPHPAERKPKAEKASSDTGVKKVSRAEATKASTARSRAKKAKAEDVEDAEIF